MCCQRTESRMTAGIPGCGCNRFSRRFFSAKEEKEILEKYAEELNREIAGVEEHIEKLKNQ